MTVLRIPGRIGDRPGLARVYGFGSAAGSFIRIDSADGVGTISPLYLHCHVKSN